MDWSCITDAGTTLLVALLAGLGLYLALLLVRRVARFQRVPGASGFDVAATVALGTLCVLGTAPRAFAAAAETSLGNVAAVAVDASEERRRAAAPAPSPSDAEPSDVESASEPLVTVVIPTYNRPAATVRAAESVLAQTYRAFELLVVDDASTDDTAARVEALKDPRLKVLRQPANQGVAAARNRGLDEAGGRFVAFLDSDDVWFPEKLRRQVAVLRDAPPRVGLVYTGAETRRADGTVEVFRPTWEGDLYARLLWRNVLHGGGSSVLMRREVAEAVGGFDTSLPAIEDWEYWIRAARRFEVTAVPEPLMRYADHESEARRSRDVLANARARQMLYARYREALRAAGLAQRFQGESLYRIRTERAGWSAGGLVLALQILLREAGDVAAAVWAWLGA